MRAVLLALVWLAHLGHSQSPAKKPTRPDSEDCDKAYVLQCVPPLAHQSCCPAEQRHSLHVLER